MIPPDGAAEAGHPLAQADEPGFLQGEVARDAAQHEHHLERPVAAHLVSEVGSVG